MTISAIARHVGHDRKTVRKALQRDRPSSGYARTTRRESPIEPFKPYIRQRLKDYDLTAIRLLEEIRKQGYAGGYTTVKEFVAEVKDQQTLKAVVRFETQPGGQGQVDWADFGRVTIDGAEHRVSLFGMVLGYSRMRYAEFVLDTSTPTLLACHLDAFQYFGGYPQELLYDNMKTVVLERRDKHVRWNPLFEDFAKHFAFTPRLCQPYRARTKGKIERVVKFVRYGFFEGRTFTSLQDLNQQLRVWLDEVNARPHGTTNVPPRERLQEERLQRVEGKPAYVVTLTFPRKVSRECFVSYQGNKYSVPWKHAMRDCLLRIRQERLLVEVAGEVVAEHDVLTGARQVSRNREHFQGLLKITRERTPQPRRTLDWPEARLPDVERRPLSVYDRLLTDFGGESS